VIRRARSIPSSARASSVRCVHRSDCASLSRTPRGKCGSAPWSPRTSNAEKYSTRVVRRRSKNSRHALFVLRSYSLFHLHGENFIFEARFRWRKRGHAGWKADMPPQSPDFDHQLVTFLEQSYFTLCRERQTHAHGVESLHLFERVRGLGAS